MSEENAQVKVEFYLHPVVDREASVKAGRRIYRSEAYIKVQPRGYKDFVSRRVSEQDKHDYPVAWARFENAQNRDAGTPLDKLPSWSPEAEAELKALGIRTLEDLAAKEVAADLKHLQQQAQWFIEMKEASNGSDSKVA